MSFAQKDVPVNGVMSILPLEQAVSTEEVKLSLDFSREQLVRHWAQQHDAEIMAVDYAQQVMMQLSVPEAVIDVLNEFCAAYSIIKK